MDIASRTFQFYVRIWVLFHGRQVVLVFVFIAGLHDIPVRVELGRVALKDVSVVSGMFDTLRDAIS
jgi:hypothetical protein